MFTKRSYLMAAFSIAVAMVAVLAMSPDAFAAAAVHAAPAGHFDLQSLLFQATPALIALRSEHAGLVTRAAAKIGEMTDGLAPADVTRIEREHADLVRQAETLSRRIDDEAARAVPPGPTPAPEAGITAERARSAEIMSIGTRAAMSGDDITAAINAGTTVEVFRARAFDAMAAAADRTRSGNVTITRDETQTRMSHLSDALAFRIGGAGVLLDDNGQRRAISAEARAFTDHSLAEMAGVVLNERRMPGTAAGREDVLRRAMHTTSDFPVIFESTINRVLAARYQVQAPTFREISARRNFRDFRPHDQIRVGDFPTLQKVNEAGEIKFGTFGDSKETVAVAPYAIQFAISRRMLIDDNIGAIDQVLGSYGDMVSRFEEATFYAMKALNAGKGPRLNEGGVSVFHADHGNLAAAGAGITTDALSLGRAAMRKQKNQSGALLNVQPAILLVGADQETAADRALAVITPTDAGDVNPFSKKLRPIVGPIEGNAWELYADPSVMPVFVWGMLDGYGAPRMRIENPFGVQGVGVSLEHDFGCGAIDFRGGYRNAGA